MKLGQLLFNTVINVFASFAKLIFNEIIQPIIYALSDIIQKSMNTIIDILKDIFNPLKIFFNQINNVSNLIKSITFVQYSQLLIDNIIKWAIKFILMPLKVIPIIGTIIEYILINPYILFYIIIGPLIISLCLIFMGQILSIIYFIKHIIYMLIGCDNDVDFILYILSILETFNIIKKST